jgi:hypothetical protein
MKEDLTKFIKALGRYASYYETGDTRSKEADIIRCWLDSKYRGRHQFVSGAHQTDGDDPPDFVLQKENERPFGIEITELVDQEAVRQWSKGNHEYYIWKPKEIQERVEAILRNKEDKILKKHNHDLSDFEDLLLLIHTDEATLRFDMLQDALNEKRLVSKVFSQIHIMMPPTPNADPYVEGDLENHPLSDRNVNQLYELKCQQDGVDNG